MLKQKPTYLFFVARVLLGLVICAGFLFLSQSEPRVFHEPSVSSEKSYVGFEQGYTVPALDPCAIMEDMNDKWCEEKEDSEDEQLYLRSVLGRVKQIRQSNCCLTHLSLTSAAQKIPLYLFLNAWKIFH